MRMKSTLILWCCVLYHKTIVECHRDNVSERDALKGLMLEAIELENNFSEIEKSSNLTALYQRLFDRVERVRLYGNNEDDERALSNLKLISRNRLIDVEEEPSLIVDLDSYASLVVTKIDLRNRMIPAIENINDVDLQTNLNLLRFRANRNFMLSEYYHYVEGFQLAYFPYAVCYLESLRQPNSSTAYDNLITMTLTKQLNESKRYVEDVKSNLRDVTYLGGREQEDAFYIWKNPDVLDKIRQLFKGEKITLVADLKTATNQLNALKFNKLDFVFRSSDQTVESIQDTTRA